MSEITMWCDCGERCHEKAESLEAERDRLKAELRDLTHCPQCKVIEGEFHNEHCCLWLIQKDRDFWKSKAEKLVEVLKECEKFQPRALEICRKNKFIFDGKGKRWEKLAFTFYTDLCEINNKAKDALEEFGVGE